MYFFFARAYRRIAIWCWLISRVLSCAFTIMATFTGSHIRPRRWARRHIHSWQRVSHCPPARAIIYSFYRINLFWLLFFSVITLKWQVSRSCCLRKVVWTFRRLRHRFSAAWLGERDKGRCLRGLATFSNGNCRVSGSDEFWQNYQDPEGFGQYTTGAAPDYRQYSGARRKTRRSCSPVRWALCYVETILQASEEDKFLLRNSLNHVAFESTLHALLLICSVRVELSVLCAYLLPFKESCIWSKKQPAGPDPWGCWLFVALDS